MPQDDGHPYDPEEARAAQEWLNNASTVFLLCRNNHNFPKLVPGRNGNLPSGITATPLLGRTGSFQVTQRCRDCGTRRRFTYLRGTDLFEASRHYSYEWPEGYRMPKGALSYISVAECKQAAYGREDVAQLLYAMAKAAAAKDYSDEWE
jgi:hypothetical protein